MTLSKILRCMFGIHEWERHQVEIDCHGSDDNQIIVAWDQCNDCGKSRLVDILA